MKKISKDLLKNNGLTLLEILLYFSVLAIIITAVLSFSIRILNLSGKSDNSNELQANIDFIGDQIETSIQTANSVNNNDSIWDNDTGKLSLNMPIPSPSPINYYIDNENIFIKEGNQTAEKINSNYLRCTKLRFNKIIVKKAPDQIIIDLRCEPLNTEYKELLTEISFHKTVSLRK